MPLIFAAVSAQLGTILGQLDNLRAGVTMSVKGGVPLLGALNRQSFQASGDPGR